MRARAHGGLGWRLRAVFLGNQEAGAFLLPERDRMPAITGQVIAIAAVLCFALDAWRTKSVVSLGLALLALALLF